MIKKISLKLIIACLLFPAAIIAIQLFRLENINQVVSPIVVAKKNFKTMSKKNADLEGEQLKVYIYKDDTDLSIKVAENLRYSLEYAKVPYKFVSAGDLETLSPSPYHLLVLTGENSTEWPYGHVESFVRNGGRLVFTNRFINKEWYELAGIEEEFGFSKTPVFGMKFDRPLFPGYVEIEGESGLAENSIIKVSLKDNAKTYISSKGNPLLWTYPYGNGKVVYWNSTMLSSKDVRGLLLHSLGLASPAFVTAQAAVKVIFIDDFPSPVPAGTSKSIKEQFNMSISDFYKKIWWEDVKGWGKKYDLKYTSAFIGTYRDDDELSAEDLIKNGKNRMTFYGRQILEEGGEVGFHGYNHQSLVTKDENINPAFGYKPWKDQAHMEIGLSRAKDLFDHFFPNQSLETYVPPSNVLNETGMKALQNAMPNINIISALYVGNPEFGDYIQEFGFNDQYPGVYNFPRITSNYNPTKEDEFIQNDAIANFGMVSHFFHPDDVLDEHRAGDEGWMELRKSFEENLKKLSEYYPYLEPLTAQEARNKMVKYQEGEINIRYSDQFIYITGDEILNPSHLLVRIEEGKMLDTGEFDFGTVNRLKDSEDIYVVELKEPEAKLEIKESMQ
ncbi:DUF2194 domain-containing protein [Bacillus salacetis]|uniref:DUF2194 domain-containing protein n=1 Tax=Bacillus salacetis TaxID=2315464 RepID=UPI003B9F12F1